MDVKVVIGCDSIDDLRELAVWLQREEPLRGRVHLAQAVAEPDRMGVVDAHRVLREVLETAANCEQP